MFKVHEIHEYSVFKVQSFLNVKAVDVYTVITICFKASVARSCQILISMLVQFRASPHARCCPSLVPERRSGKSRCLQMDHYRDSSVRLPS